MRHHYQAEQWLPYSVPLVFAFFANPDNLPRLMPPWQQARIDWAFCKAPPPRPLPADRLRYGTVVAGEGSKLTLSFSPFPYSPARISWKAEITEFAWNDHFCDRQIQGPFAYWDHCHRVQSETRNAIPGTLITDQVEYELPFGLFGTLAHRLLLRRQIARSFACRHTLLADILAATPSHSLSRP